MITFLLSIIPAPWLVVLKKIPWRLIGYIVVAAIIAVSVWRVIVWRDFYRTGQAEIEQAHAALRAEQDCDAGTKCASRLVQLQVDGEAAVKKAVEAAQEAAAAAQAKLDASAALERERLATAASASAAREESWRRKYIAATSLTGSACAKWSQETVPCPIAD